jgi:hypothetical protein
MNSLMMNRTLITAIVITLNVMAAFNLNASWPWGEPIHQDIAVIAERLSQTMKSLLPKAVLIDHLMT